MTINVDEFSKIQELTTEEVGIIEWLNNAERDPSIIEAAKRIIIQNYYAPIMAGCRRRAELTQEQLAEKFDCATNKIEKIETNRAVVKIVFLIKWSKIINSKDALTALCMVK